MSLVKFQERIGATPDGVFGKQTLKKGMDYLKISPEQAAHFFAQTAHETGGFSLFVENLNYSADRLLQVFPKYFPTKVLAMSYSRQPEKIANRVYANRMGNGPESSGDGYTFRGRGALQLTGKANYTAFSLFLKKPEVLANPNLVATDYAFDSALYFFAKNGLWVMCTSVSDEAILKVTKRINGGVNGLAHRKELTEKYYALLTSD
jgi:putative chitinase